MGFGAPFGFGFGFDLGIAWSPVAELAAASSRSEIRNYVYNINGYGSDDGWCCVFDVFDALVDVAVGSCC